MKKRNTKALTTWVGIDLHALKMTVAFWREGEGEPFLQFEQETNRRGMGRLAAKLGALPGRVRCVYEAGPCGYTLQRFLQSKGIECEVAAPSLIPRRPGDKVKTDKRDAIKLAGLYRADQLTMVHIPDEEQEQLRDLTRAREAADKDLLRARHRLKKFLLRRGHYYHAGNAWTQRHWAWIRAIGFEEYYDQQIFEQYIRAVQERMACKATLTQLVAEAAKEPQHQAAIETYSLLRGMQTVTALTIKAEGGDLKGYHSAPAFMKSLGAIPSEYSSGPKRRQGSITKAGNAHLRRVLVEAAWHYTRRSTGGRVERRRQGKDPVQVAIARKADARVRATYRRLVRRGKPKQVAIVAATRELSGFVWALGQHIGIESRVA